MVNGLAPETPQGSRSWTRPRAQPPTWPSAGDCHPTATCFPGEDQCSCLGEVIFTPARVRASCCEAIAPLAGRVPKNL